MTIDESTGAVTVAQAALEAQTTKASISIEKTSDAPNNGNYTLTLSGYTAPGTKSWVVTGKTAIYKLDDYYAEDSGAIVYHSQADNTAIVTLTLDKSGITAAQLAEYLTVTEPVDDGKGTITVKSATETQTTTVADAGTGDEFQDSDQQSEQQATPTKTYLATGFTVVNTDNYTIEFATGENEVGNPTVSSEKLYISDPSTGKVQVKGDWSTGYYIDGKKLTYSEAKTDQVLATISGLAKNSKLTGNKNQNDKIIVDSNSDDVIALDTTADKITLSKGALHTGAVTIVNNKTPNGTTENAYKLALDSDVTKATIGTDEDGKRTETAPDAKDVWELNSSGTQATYKNVIPAYYTVAADEKSITYTAQVTTKTGSTENIYGVIKGLTAQGGTLVVYDDDEGNSSIGVATTKTTTTGEGEDAVTTTNTINAPGVTVSEPTEGDGNDAKTYHTFSINQNVLPTDGSSVQLQSTSDDSKLALGKDTNDAALTSGQAVVPSAATEASGTEGQEGYVPASPGSLSWTVSNGDATLKAKLGVGYILKDDRTIKSYAAADNVDLVTISGLSDDFDPTKAGFKLSDYLTVEGVADDNKDTASAGADQDAEGEDGHGTITITLKNAALNEGTVSIKSFTDSFKYKLALDADARLEGDNDGSISDTKDIWVFNGTTATYKQVTPAHYEYDTATGKIKFVKQADLQTYATIKGLNDTVLSNAKLTFGADGKVYTKKTENNEEVEDQVFITIDNKNITLNKNILGTANVTLTDGKDKDGKDLGYSLAINEDDAIYKVVAPDVTAQWWTVDASGTATLHQSTQEGYVLEGNTLKYHAAVDDSTLATITGLSTDVKALKADGTELTAAALKALDDEIETKKTALASADEDGKAAAQTALDNAIKAKADALKDSALGIAQVKEGEKTVKSRAVVAHTVLGTAGEKDTPQEITLTDAMLDEKKVALKDNNANDTNTFKLVLQSEDDGGPATETAKSNSWSVGGDANATTLTYQSYDKGYYTLDSSTNVVSYTKDSAPQKLFTLTVNKNSAVTGIELSGTEEDNKFYFDKDNPNVLKYNKKAFATVNDDETITINKDAASTAADNNIVFKANASAYAKYTFTDVEKDGSTSKMVTWAKPAWTVETAGTATLSKTPTTAGYELSSDSQTLTYRSDKTDLLTVSGLDTPALPANSASPTDVETAAKAFADKLQYAYDDDTKEVTLPNSVLGSSSKIKLTPETEFKNDGFTLKLNDDVRTKAESGFSWTATADGQVVAKAVTQDYYTTDTTTVSVTYHKEAPSATLFTISGLNTTAIPSATFTDKDGDNVLNADKVVTINEKEIKAGTEYLTFDTATSEVTIENTAVLSNDKDTSITIKGTNWKFKQDSVPEYSFKGNGTWTVSNDGVATLKFADADVNAGYKISTNGQTLTYVTGEQTVLTISGLATPPTGEDATEFNKGLVAALKDAYDVDSKTVTLPESVLGTATKIKLTPDAAYKTDSFTLQLDSEVNTDSNKVGTLWTITDGDKYKDASDKDVQTKTVTAKKVNMAYFVSDTATSISYKKEVPIETLFTISGLVNKDEALSDLVTDNVVTDKDGDDSLGNDLITFAGEGANAKVTIAASLLPTTDGKAAALDSKTTYTLVDDYTAPNYQDSNAKWNKDSDGNAILVNAPSNAGWTLDDKQKTLTHVTATNHDIMTLSGLTNDITKNLNGTTAISGIEVSMEDKTLTLSKSVLEGTSKITADKASGYKLAIDDSVQVGEKKNGNDKVEEDVWNLVEVDGTTKTITAYRRKVYPEYYTVDGATSNTVTFHSAVKRQDLFSISGLPSTVALNAEGEVAASANATNALISLDKDSTNSDITVVSIGSDALADGLRIATGKNYRFELANNEAKLGQTKTFTYNEKEGTVIVTGTYDADKYLVSADGQSIKKIASDKKMQTLATISGLKKVDDSTNTAVDVKDQFEFDEDSRTITFLTDTLLVGTTKITTTDSGNFFDYKLALASEINTDKNKAGTKWDVGSSTVKFLATTEAAYTIDTKTYKSIATQNQKDGKATVSITGLNIDKDIADTTKANYKVVAGTDENSFTLEPTTTGTAAGKKKVEDAIVVDKANGTVTLKADVLPPKDGAESSTVKLTATGYKLVLDPSDDSIPTAPTYDTFKATQAKNSTDLTLTATASSYYTKKGNDTITYTPAKTETAMAKLTGLKKATDEKNINAAAAAIKGSSSTQLGFGIKIDTEDKIITVDDDALDGADVTLTTTQGYKLALNDDQVTDASDIWSYDNSKGEAVWKTAVPAHYALANSDTKIKSVAENTTKTYFTIKGLTTTANAISVGSDSSGESIMIQGTSGTTKAIDYEGGDTITLSLAALPSTYNKDTKITVTKGKDGNATYKLALDEKAAATTFYDSDGEGHKKGDVKEMGVAVEDTKAFSLDGTKVVYAAPIKAGYTSSGTSIVVVDGTTKKNYFTITGLNIPAAESAEDKALSEDAYINKFVTVDSNNTVTIKPDALGTSKVTISNSEYELALDDSVPRTNETVQKAELSNGTLTLKSYEQAYYTINTKGEIEYKKQANAKTLATVTGLKSGISSTDVENDDKLKDKIKIDWDTKEITIPKTTHKETVNKEVVDVYDVLGTSNISIGTGKADYSLKFNDVTDTPVNTWTASGGNATLNSVSREDTYKLSEDAKTITYTKAGDKTEILKVTGLKSSTAAKDAAGTGTLETTNSIDGISVAKSGDDITVTLDNRVLAEKNAVVTGSNVKLALDTTTANKVAGSLDGSTTWEYSATGKDANKSVTFTLKNNAYYDFTDESSTTAKYHAAATLASISGKDFNSTIMNPTGDDDAAKATAAKTEFEKYVELKAGTDADGDTPAVAPKLTIKASGLMNETNDAADKKSLTITTPKVNGVTYDVALGTGGIETTSDQTWSISGTSLILNSGLTAGYTLANNKLTYSKANAGVKVFTIKGLDLTGAKAAMVEYDSTQKAALKTLEDAVTTAQDTYNNATEKDAKDTADTALTAAKKALADKEDEYKAANLKTYIESKLNISGDTIKVGKDLLGTSNITIENSGSANYKLAIGLDTDEGLYKTKEAAETAASGAAEWTFSGGTATYKVGTVPAYYTLKDATKADTIVYNKSTGGTVAATIKGLGTTKNEYSSGEVSVATEDAEKGTSTTTQDFYTDTTVVQLKNGVIGTVTTRKTRRDTTVVTTTTGEDGKTSTDTKTTKGEVTTADQAFVSGLTLDEKTITLSKNVLGTGNVTLTNAKDQDYKLAVNTDTTASAALKVTAPTEDTVAWTGAVNGTTATFKADYSAGYTLEDSDSPKKITYTAAKNGVTLLTLSGIKIRVPEAAITAQKTARARKLDKEVTALTKAEITEATNKAINAWLDARITVGETSENDGKTVGDITLSAVTDGTADTADTMILNKANVTAKSSDKNTTYNLVLDDSLKDLISTDPQETYAWKGTSYQKYNSAYYEEQENGSIKYTADGKATTLATVSGLKSGTTISTTDSSAAAYWNNNILTLKAAALGTSKVTLKKSKGVDEDFSIDLADDVNTDTDTAYNSAWTVSGTTATKKNGGNQAYYTLAEDGLSVTYKADGKDAEGKSVQTLATITGLKNGVTSINDVNGEVTLTKNDLDKANVKITNGKDAGDTNYIFKLDSEVKAPSITKAEENAWTTKGVNTTLKGSATDGWELSADKKTAIHTAEATNKAIATFTFDKSGIATETEVALTDNVLTVSKSGENTKVTVKTNPYGLEFKVGNGFSSFIGSGAADKFDLDAASSITLSGGAGDDIIKLGTGTKVSVGGGAGNDSIYGAGKDELIVLGDAGNDTINITEGGTTHSINGGAGDDHITVVKAENVMGDAGNDTINVTDEVTTLINGGAGNDILNIAKAGAITIKGDAGNDVIDITSSANKSTIYGGAGNDSIKIASATDVSVLGEAGNDTIDFTGSGTIYGGAGNDSIKIGTGAVTFFYASGDGNDVVDGWSNDDKFVLKTGAIKTASIGGADSKDLILTIGSNKVTLSGAGENAKGTFSYTSGTDTSEITIAGGSASSGDIAYDTTDLITDTNFITPNDISDLVKTNSVTEYHIGNYNLSTPDQVLAESDLITYSDDKNGNNK